MYDCHLHTQNSFDGKSTIDQVCQISIKNNIKGICLTDHVELECPFNPNGGITDYLPNFSDYHEEFLQAKDLYSNKLEMAIGIEIGLQQGLEAKNINIIKEAQPDFIIGSVHSIDGLDIYSGDFSKAKSQFQTYMEYLERVLLMVKTQDYFHVLGHLDMILRDNSFETQVFDRNEYFLLVTDILKTIIKNGKGIEVNSSGWRYNLTNPLPHPKIIKMYKDLGGTTITTGSDSHYPNSVNAQIPLVTQILKDIGYTKVSYFLKGKEEKRNL